MGLRRLRPVLSGPALRWDQRRLGTRRELIVAETPAAGPKRRRGDWRHRENRASPKFVSKRVSAADHQALTKYADDHGVKVAEMLEPFINDLIERAHQHCAVVDEAERPARAS